MTHRYEDGREEKEVLLDPVYQGQNGCNNLANAYDSSGQFVRRADVQKSAVR